MEYSAMPKRQSMEYSALGHDKSHRSINPILGRSPSLSPQDARDEKSRDRLSLSSSLHSILPPQGYTRSSLQSISPTQDGVHLNRHTATIVIDTPHDKDDSFRAKAVRYGLGVVLLGPFVVSWLLRKRVFPNMNSTDKHFVKWGNYLGDASFAITGAMTAGNTGMDLLGVMICGFLTALGGGTIRDVLLGNTPVGWMSAYDEIVLCNVCSLLVFYLWPQMVRRWNFSTEDEWLFWTDAIGIGIFAATGAHTGLQHEASIYGCGLCGMISVRSWYEIFSLVICCCCRQPSEGSCETYSANDPYSTCEIYAPCGLLGGLCTAVMATYADDMVPEALLLGTWVGVMARVICYNHFLTLPLWTIQEVRQTVPLHNERFDAPYLGTRGNQAAPITRARARSASLQTRMIPTKTDDPSATIGSQSATFN